jgi:hypothetical protein
MSKLTEASYPFFQGLELLTRMNPLMQISEVSIKVCFVGPPSHSINDQQPNALKPAATRHPRAAGARAPIFALGFLDFVFLVHLVREGRGCDQAADANGSHQGQDAHQPPRCLYLGN